MKLIFYTPWAFVSRLYEAFTRNIYIRKDFMVARKLISYFNNMDTTVKLRKFSIESFFIRFLYNFFLGFREVNVMQKHQFEATGS